MTVRSVDLQTMIPRTGEAGRIQHARENLAGAAQQAGTVKVKQQDDRKRRQVTGSKEAEKLRVSPDGRNGSGGGAKRSKDEPEGEPGKGGRLDVKV